MLLGGSESILSPQFGLFLDVEDFFAGGLLIWHSGVAMPLLCLSIHVSYLDLIATNFLIELNLNFAITIECLNQYDSSKNKKMRLYLIRISSRNRQKRRFNPRFKFNSNSK